VANTLEPRTVEVRDIRDWMRESCGLFQRRLFVFMSVSIAFHFLAYSARSLGAIGILLGILLCQISIALSIAIADAADRATSLTFKSALLTVRKLIWYLLVLTALYTAIFLLAFVIGLYIDMELPSIDYSAKPLFSQLAWLAYGHLAFMIIYMGIVITSFWFLNPLLALHSLTLRDSISLAKRAEARNFLVVFVASYPIMLVLIAFELISELSLFLNIFLVPLFGIYQFVSYRHVFLGKKENSPVMAPEEKLAAVPVETGQEA